MQGPKDTLKYPRAQGREELKRAKTHPKSWSPINPTKNLTTAWRWLKGARVSLLCCRTSSAEAAVAPFREDSALLSGLAEPGFVRL